MSAAPVLRAPWIAMSLLCVTAHAQSRCDCTTILETCSATVTVEQDALAIESDHLQCSRVDYLVDGLPFVALVVEGSQRQARSSVAGNPKVLMQSCQVCLDRSASTAASGPADGLALEPARPPAAEPPVRLIAVEPQYPQAAAARRVDGFAEVSFTVTALGRVENAAVTAAQPEGVFEQAALAAISRWRYSVDESREPVTLHHRFDFKAAVANIAVSRSAPETAIDALIAHSTSAQEGGDAEVASAPVSIARNHCIREQLSYDFGDLMDVSLMNTCSEPLLVYSCAEGLGRYQRRWVCQSSENTQSILVRPGDRLAGNVAMIAVPEGVRTFKYTEDIYVARPRNTEYWWLACAIDDAECRGSGRQWARSMDGKAASVDPQLWTQQGVARSL